MKNKPEIDYSKSILIIFLLVTAISLGSIGLSQKNIIASLVAVVPLSILLYLIYKL